MLVDNDSFDRFPLFARQARFAPWCLHHKRDATPRANKGNRPPVGLCGPPGRRGPQGDAPASGKGRNAPGGPQSPIKWVIISEHWYMSWISG